MFKKVKSCAAWEVLRELDGLFQIKIKLFLYCGDIKRHRTHNLEQTVDAVNVHFSPRPPRKW